jgi:hypothetical protein
MKLGILFLLLLLPCGAALAADSTIAVTPGSGATIVVSPDGSGNIVPHSIQCDHTTPTNCAAYDASGAAATKLVATTSGGCTPYHLSGGTAASNNSTNIKSSAGNLCVLAVYNDGTGSATVVDYLKVYDSGSAPTCSSATGLKHVFPIPVSASVAGLVWSVALNESYASGIGFCVVSGGADTSNGNAVTGIYVEGSYK